MLVEYFTNKGIITYDNYYAHSSTEIGPQKDHW